MYIFLMHKALVFLQKVAYDILYDIKYFIELYIFFIRMALVLFIDRDNNKIALWFTYLFILYLTVFWLINVITQLIFHRIMDFFTSL